MRLYRYPLLLALALAAIAPLAGCGGTKTIESTPTAPVKTTPAPTASHTPTPTPMPPVRKSTAKPLPGWTALLDRLRKDNVDNEVLASYFGGLPEYSPAPMSVKVKELYQYAFAPKPPRDPNAPPPSSIYKNIITTANVQRCNDFMTENAVALKKMEAKHGVPKEVITALLFVETRLGTYLGNEQAFWSLACMAASDSHEKVRTGITGLDITPEREPWLQSKLTEKSNWAYKELKAMMSFCRLQNLNPQTMPGSVYGAIGICQFMPSNLAPYGEDGDGDGVVDLFQPADAIFSSAHYLSGHGWKSNASIDARRKVIKAYNNSNRYANTILALAESIRSGVLLSKAPTE